MHKFSFLIFFCCFILKADAYTAENYFKAYNFNDPAVFSSACKGVDSSAIKYIVSGRPGPYSFTWRELGSGMDLGTRFVPNSIDSINITGLDGTLNYEVEVRDNFNALICQDTFRFNTIGTLGINPLVNSGPSCFGDSDGSATAVTLIGSQQVLNPEDQRFSFEWSNGDLTETASGLSGGNVSVLVTSQEGCTASASFVMTEPGVLTVNASTTSPSCPGLDDGAISLDINGGTPSSGSFPYTIQWSTGLADLNANPLNGLSAGDYAVTVTDINLCQVIRSFTIADPSAVSIDAFANLTPSLCSRGTCSGQVEIQVSGGANPGAGYIFQWSNGENIATPTSLCAGWNTIAVSNSGCTPIIDSVLVTSSNDVVVNVVDSANVNCFGSTDGTIQVLANGGSTAMYAYNWSDAQSSDVRTNLSAGTYEVTATDINGCTSLPRSITLTQPDSLELVVDLGGTLNPRCSDTDNGILAVRWIRGGNMSTTPSYTWSPNTPNAPNAPVATELPSGTYTVTITDGNGCTDQASYTLNAPPPLQGQMTSPMDPNCFGELTELTVASAIGGTGTTFTFAVNNGPQRPLGAPIEVLAGTQIISVFDRNACRWDTTIMILQPDEVTVNLVDEISVNLGDSSQLMPNVPASIALSTIVWSPPGNLTCTDCLMPWVIPTQSATYEVTVTDENGCVGSDRIRVNLNRMRNVFVPNAFSPNNDGINDFFQLSLGTGVNRITYLRIFDRWGNMVYEQENYLPGGATDGWNGELKGRDLNMGTYVYISEVEFQDATKLVFRGSVNLVR